MELGRDSDTGGQVNSSANSFETLLLFKILVIYMLQLVCFRLSMSWN